MSHDTPTAKQTVLLSLARYGRPVCVFARHFERITGEPMTDRTASTLLRRMQSRGWLDVRVSHIEGRVHLYCITPDGVAAYDRARAEAARLAALPDVLPP